MTLPELHAVRIGMAELDETARRLLEGVDLGPDRWDGEASEIRTQHKLAMLAIDDAAARFAILERLLAAKP